MVNIGPAQWQHSNQLPSFVADGNNTLYTYNYLIIYNVQDKNKLIIRKNLAGRSINPNLTLLPPLLASSIPQSSPLPSI